MLIKKYGDSHTNFWLGNNSVIAVVNLYKESTVKSETVIAKVFEVEK